MKTFFMGDLVPGRIQPNYDSLAFLAEVFKQHGSFKDIDKSDPVTVINIDGVLVLGRGNNRATLLVLNGFNLIKAFEKRLNQENEEPEILEMQQRFYELRQRASIRNIYDLAAKVERPEQYRV